MRVLYLVYGHEQFSVGGAEKAMKEMYGACRQPGARANCRQLNS